MTPRRRRAIYFFAFSILRHYAFHACQIAVSSLFSPTFHAATLFDSRCYHVAAIAFFLFRLPFLPIFFAAFIA